ncbi:MAG TPA: trehalase family glycosidase [Candidatus Nitrosopolaris sp.]|nr:trehalase family glycosidase [Candidatus Nitrosopolaris sp.]
MAEEQTRLLQEAEKVLKHNDRGKWVMPAANLYPHQWLWDSCFIAIGLRHLNVERAQTELKSLLRGQWSNGMLPNIIFSGAKQYRRDRELWRSWVSPYSPSQVATSGITQPPMLAEAVLQIGQKLKLPERRSWYQQMYPALLHYHEWLYNERDPHHEGLIVLLHPYEGGLDDSPPWISELRKHNMPLWLTAAEKARLGSLIQFFRRDTQHTTLAQRMSNIEAAAYWAAMHRLRRKAYNSEAILSRSLFSLEDLAFNCIFIRANDCLKKIAADIKQELPPALLKNMANTESALEQLWDESSGQYFSRSFVSHKLIEESSVATLLPLYAGSISKERAARLVELLQDKKWFASNWPVPSVPRNSPYFEPCRYWQGPAWINTDWLIIKGLENYGFSKEAASLRQKSLDLVAKSGFYEYFNPLTAEPAGAQNFSWTAALIIDLLKS